MKTTLRCEDCGKTFTKESVQHAEAALRMHRHRAHTGRIPTARSAENKTRRLEVARRLEPAVHTPVVHEPVEAEPLCFCPRCGVNLAAIAMALRVAAKIS